MSLHRFTSWTLLAVTGFALLPGPIAAVQPPKSDLPPRPAGYSKVMNYKTSFGIPPDAMKDAKDAFAAFAKYNADYISLPRVYTAVQDFRSDQPPAMPVPYTTDALIYELNRHILVPTAAPGVGGTLVSPESADYIRELGAALDAELKTVIERNPEPVVQINATRMLAAACRSGATAHYPTVTALITNPATPPAVKYYAFQAAANLLDAYNLNDYQSRKHSAPAKEAAALITALQDAIEKPGTILPAAKGAAPTPEQAQVVGFIRRQAVRALARVRFGEFKVTRDGPTLYPAFTLARVATSDPALAPPPGEIEVAEAVIGICNMAPPRGEANVPYSYAMADAVATGILTFTAKRTGDPGDKSLPWRGYAARLRDAFQVWPALYDVNWNPAKPKAFTPLAPKPVTDVITDAERRIVTPMDGSGTLSPEQFKQVRDNLRGDPKWTLSPFRDSPNLKLPKKD